MSGIVSEYPICEAWCRSCGAYEIVENCKESVLCAYRQIPDKKDLLKKKLKECEEENQKLRAWIESHGGVVE